MFVFRAHSSTQAPFPDFGLRSPVPGPKGPSNTGPGTSEDEMRKMLVKATRRQPKLLSKSP
eukprot:3993442-Pyramimonas_sp.AAC.1